MANLPLETQPFADDDIKKRYKGRDHPPLIISVALLLGVLISDALILWQVMVSIFFIGGLLFLVLRPFKQGPLAIIALAAFLAGVAAHYIEQYHHQVTLLDKSREAVVEAVIIKQEKQANSRVRLWLDELRLDGQERDGILRATIDQMSAEAFHAPVASKNRFKGTLRLYPLTGSLFPGWPDYSRKSWREGIIASAYGRAPHITTLPEAGDRAVIVQWRDKISDQISNDLNPSSAHLAKALLIGVRDFSDDGFHAPFRHAGLAHLLAISGLHMGLFCFGIYGMCRLCLAMPVGLSAKVAPHKIAAVLAIASGTFYLALAGSPISAIRAYFMVSIVLMALLFDRRMVTIRSMTIVFCGFLLLYPSALYQPAFQLSFAATFGIVMFHDSQKARHSTYQNRWVRRVLYLGATSAIAIASTFFITAFHFGTISAWGVLSNIIAIPYTGLVIMPVGIAYLFVIPFGLSAIIAPVLDVVLIMLIGFAGLMASLPLSEIRLYTPPAFYLPLFAILGAASFYANGKGRLFISVVGLIAIILWLGQVRPFGAITGGDNYRRIAIYEDGTLYHSHRLTDFWAQSYIKLFGPYHHAVKVNCRRSCDISLKKTPYQIHVLSQKNTACSLKARQVTLTSDHICHKHITAYEQKSDISLLLYNNNELGVYFKEK